MPKQITEEEHLEKDWFAEASKQTLDTLPDFMKRVMDDYTHDYGTLCHAIAACAIAAACAANEMDGARGGITGFQAGFVMWDFIRQWKYTSNKCGLRIIDYDNMLYPQYEDRFQKTISANTWNGLIKQAEENLKNRQNAHPKVIAHWESIKNGHVPFGYEVKEDA